MVELKIKSPDGNKVTIEQGDYAFGLVGTDKEECRAVISGDFDISLFITQLIQVIDRVFSDLTGGNEEKAQVYKKTFALGFAHYQLEKLKKETPED